MKKILLYILPLLFVGCEEGNMPGWLNPFSNDPVVKMTGITISPNPANVTPEKSVQLTAEIVPSNATNKKVEWVSSDKNIVTVSADGVLTPVKNGTTTVYCKALDGSGVEGKCTVNVQNVPVKVSSITLSATSLNLGVGKTSTLTYTLLPADATDKTIKWSTSNSTVATVSQSGVVTALAEGTASIVCWAMDGSGVKAECVCKVIDMTDCVDLGLPSGTLWATKNVGAKSPEEYGSYFAWGETSTKSSYDWSTYKYCKRSRDSLTKYNTSSSSGTVDNKTELDLSDDAAYVNWGSEWRMPSKGQFAELINSSYTKTEWVTQNNVYGRRITSLKNGNSIFLPAAGYRNDSSLFNAGSYGLYWSRTLYSSYPLNAWYLFFYSGDVSPYSNYRDYGLSVRPVRR